MRTRRGNILEIIIRTLKVISGRHKNTFKNFLFILVDFHVCYIINFFFFYILYISIQCYCGCLRGILISSFLNTMARMIDTHRGDKYIVSKYIHTPQVGIWLLRPVLDYVSQPALNHYIRCYRMLPKVQPIFVRFTLVYELLLLFLQ